MFLLWLWRGCSEMHEFPMISHVFWVRAYVFYRILILAVFSKGFSQNFPRTPTLHSVFAHFQHTQKCNSFGNHGKSWKHSRYQRSWQIPSFWGPLLAGEIARSHRWVGSLDRCMLDWCMRDLVSFGVPFLDGQIACFHRWLDLSDRSDLMQVWSS